MTIPHIFASAPMPAPINSLEAILAVIMILACFRHLARFADDINEKRVFFLLLYSSGPLVLTTLFSIFHAWSIFAFSEPDATALRQCAYSSTYNLAIGAVAFVVNTAVVTISKRRE